MKFKRMNALKKYIFAILIIVSCAVSAAIPGTTSGPTKIVAMETYTTYVLIKLQNSAGGCGSADNIHWKLPIDSTESNRYKRSVLLAAYMAGKTVELRCESSQITDFSISN
jgi:hypothetical protein